MDFGPDLTELKEAIRVLTERVDVAPCLPPPIPSLTTLTVDVESLVPNFYTLVSDVEEANIEKMGRDLEFQKKRIMR